jgi:hypothetical protein
MPLYIHKWENGDFSVVNAKSRKEALELLDEVDSPDADRLLVCDDFLATFKLPEKVTVDNADDILPSVLLEGFGEATTHFLMDNIYAEYGREAGQIFDERESGVTISSEEELERLNGALAAEKDDA